jgi:GT2 family glycosyltransferase
MERSVEARATILVLTSNHRTQLLTTLEFLCHLPGGWPIIVVDNGSSDGTAAAVALRFPKIMLICSRRNLGAAARNIGVAYVHTPYVAFCDDGMLWEPDALSRAVHLLDAASDVAVLSARVQAGAERQTDPLCLSMGRSPLAREHLSGPQLLGFMADACVMRTRAFYDVGGYWPPLFLGGEEALMALDLAERGWRMVYADDVVTRHFPTPRPDARQRQYRLIRNAIWVAWMRRPVCAAWRETHIQFSQARQCGMPEWMMLQVLLGLPRALRRRRVISPSIEAMMVLLDHAAMPPAVSSEC